jgi:UDP-N-acetylmuramoylalanine--D-glutamate ligase
MTLMTQLKNKNILVLGLGLSGLSCVRFLNSQGLTFSVNDSREQPLDVESFHRDYAKLNLSLGAWDKSLIASADIIIVSPGIDLSNDDISTHIKDNCQIWGDIELFFQVINDQNITMPTLAVTGSNGKSTVVTLLAHFAKQLQLNFCLAGNIGTPILDLLLDEQRLANLDVLILELSSFQLETLRSMNATAACVLNVSDDHLDRHKNLSSYQQIKHTIYQQAKTVLVNRDDQLTQPLSLSSEQKLLSFGSDHAKTEQFGLARVDNKLQLMLANKTLLAVEQLPISGIHNALNCLAALALGQSAGWPLTKMVNALTSFTGLAHRCQKVNSHDGIIWINDSKATNVGATLAAIEGLAQTKNNQQKLLLIAGGDGKGADFSPLKSVINSSIDLLITLGKDGDKLAQLSKKHTAVNNLVEAVAVANKFTQQGDIVLLSPACASLDMFKNFAERGNVFSQAVVALSQGGLAHE